MTFSPMLPVLFVVAFLGMGFNSLLLLLSTSYKGWNLDVGTVLMQLVCVAAMASILEYEGRWNIGRIPENIEAYNVRLTNGMVYHVLTSTPVHDGEVVVLQERSDPGLRAIRVAGPTPPEDFVLVDGKPVAVAK